MNRSHRSTALALVTLATFTDFLAYSIAVPVLPDLGARLGASPTVIGFLFSSFGLTLLTVSIPMGAVSDRIGRKTPMIIGLGLLAASTLFFAFGNRLVWLFTARLVQGAADAITWVVGLALLADLYGPEERGRVTGILMAGTGVAMMLGPSIGGWLYEVGGMRLPFLAVTALAAVTLVAFLRLRVPPPRAVGPRVTLLEAVRVPATLACIAAVIAAAGTLAMLEPVVALRLDAIGLRPGRVGTVFGAAAIMTTMLNPIYGRLADRVGPWRLMLIGLLLSALALPLVGCMSGFLTAVAFYTIEAAALTLVITPSLSFMAEASATGGGESFGLAYGLYNVGWGVGLLVGPAAGGFLYEYLGIDRMTIVWATAVIALTVGLASSRGFIRVSPRAGSV